MMPVMFWIAAIPLALASVIVIYCGYLYFGFERLGRKSPSRINTWVWILAVVALSIIGITLTQLAG